MLNHDEIQSILHADKVIPLNVRNPHGPLGLAQLQATIGRMGRATEKDEVERAISLPTDAWAKLDVLAQQLSQQGSQPITASEVARSLVVQGLENATTA